jgi:hypothetical protein
MATPTLNHEPIYNQFDTSLEFITARPDYYAEIEEDATKSAEALLRFEALYGEAATQIVIDWCQEHDQTADKAIANIVTPLAYMALGATISYRDENIDGPEVLSQHFGLPAGAFCMA